MIRVLENALTNFTKHVDALDRRRNSTSDIDVEFKEEIKMKKEARPASASPYSKNELVAKVADRYQTLPAWNGIQCDVSYSALFCQKNPLYFNS